MVRWYDGTVVHFDNLKITLMMKVVSINKSIRLSEHFTLGEVCKTNHKTADGNIPSRECIENLKNLCENWLEELRYSHNTLYGKKDEPIIITSGYRSPEVNKLVGGSPNSNHLTGCAVDIRVTGMEQAKQYAEILRKYADESHQDFDEILIEKNRYGAVWLHFAVRPRENRRKFLYINA